jgi:hypothetical protein
MLGRVDDVQGKGGTDIAGQKVNHFCNIVARMNGRHRILGRLTVQALALCPLDEPVRITVKMIDLEISTRGPWQQGPGLTYCVLKYPTIETSMVEITNAWR